MRVHGGVEQSCLDTYLFQPLANSIISSHSNARPRLAKRVKWPEKDSGSKNKMSDLDVRTEVNIVKAGVGESIDLLAPSPHLSADCFGLTDPGRHRSNNEDQFLVAVLDKALKVLQTSLPQSNTRHSSDQSYLLVVADGMGGAAQARRPVRWRCPRSKNTSSTHSSGLLAVNRGTMTMWSPSSAKPSAKLISEYVTNLSSGLNNVAWALP
jgi:hypothetical protein